jgi:hypothetical protein
MDLPSRILTGTNPLGEEMVLRSATLSVSPADTHRCLVGAICTTFEPNFICRTFLSFTRLGGLVFSCATEVEAEDIIFYEDSFYCITKIEDLVVCTPDFSVISPGTRMTLDRRYYHFLPLHHEGVGVSKGITWLRAGVSC